MNEESTCPHPASHNYVKISGWFATAKVERCSRCGWILVTEKDVPSYGFNTTHGYEQKGSSIVQMKFADDQNPGD